MQFIALLKVMTYDKLSSPLQLKIVVTNTLYHFGSNFEKMKGQQFH